MIHPVMLQDLIGQYFQQQKTHTHFKTFIIYDFIVFVLTLTEHCPRYTYCYHKCDSQLPFTYSDYCVIQY